MRIDEYSCRLDHRAAVLGGVMVGILTVGMTALRSQAETARAEIRVGIDEGDFRGSDNRVLQAAVDHVAMLGGGTVRIGPGRYEMRNALTLRSHVRIVGTAGKTVLVACDGRETRLACDGDCYERQITLDDPSGFRVGDGVSIQDEKAGGGFEVTTATLSAQVDDRTFEISAPLYLDYLVAQKATARLAFPIVGGWNVQDASVEGVTIEGNRAARGKLDGCRGGGVYLFQCEDISIRDCVVRAYNGDGISFQVSHRIVVEDCVSENNAGLGIHPGSGSQQPVVRRCGALGNGGDGLFVCWRVKHGLFEDNKIIANDGAGVSIGHKDTDNRFQRNEITGNGSSGVWFRNELEAMGAHRNVFEENRILDNGGAKSGKALACVTIRGNHQDLIFRKNTIGNSKPGPANEVGILLDPRSASLKDEDNHFVNVRTALESPAGERVSTGSDGNRR